jgi:hypothetical protein
MDLYSMVVLFPKVGKCNQTNDTYTFKPEPSNNPKYFKYLYNYAKIITEIKSTILLLYTNNI